MSRQLEFALRSWNDLPFREQLRQNLSAFNPLHHMNVSPNCAGFRSAAEREARERLERYRLEREQRFHDYASGAASRAYRAARAAEKAAAVEARARRRRPTGVLDHDFVDTRAYARVAAGGTR